MKKISVNNLKLKHYSDIYKGIAVLAYFVSTFCFTGEKVYNSVSYIFIPVLAAACSPYFLCDEKGIENNNTEVLIKQYARAMLLPYLWFSLILFAVDMIFGATGNTGTGDISDYLINILIFQGNSIMWILPALFVGNTVYVLIRKLVNEYITFCILAVLVVLYFLAGGDCYIYSDSTHVLMAVLIKLFTVMWRGVFLGLFISAGDIVNTFVLKVRTKRYIGVPTGIILVVGGTALAVNSQAVYFDSLIITAPLFSVPGSLLMLSGFMFLAEWIGEFSLVEFLGENWLVIIIMHGILRLSEFGTFIDENMVIIAENRFVAHTCNVAATFTILIILLFVFRRFLYFIPGYEKSDVFYKFKKK